MSDLWVLRERYYPRGEQCLLGIFDDREKAINAGKEWAKENDAGRPEVSWNPYGSRDKIRIDLIERGRIEETISRTYLTVDKWELNKV